MEKSPGMYGEYIEGEGMYFAPEVKKPMKEEFPSKERPHVFRVESMPLETKTYETSEGVSIEVSCKAFFPVGSFPSKEASTSGEYVEGEGLRLHEGVKNPNLKENGQSGEGCVIFPGLGITAEGQTTQDFGEAFAHSTKEPTFVITTKVLKTIKNSTYEEALAATKFLQDKGITKTTIVGNSQGGQKAIDVVSILQKEKGVKIEGLALLSSVGLREAPRSELVKDFYAKDPMLAAVDVLKSDHNKPRRRYKTIAGSVKRMGDLNSEVIGGVGKYLVEAGKGTPVQSWAKNAWERIVAELKSTSEFNPRLKEIECPVVLISGDHDNVSGLNKIVGIEKNARTRGEYLKKEILINSPSVKVYLPKDVGAHALSIMRAQEVADVAIRSIQSMSNLGNKDSSIK